MANFDDDLDENPTPTNMDDLIRAAISVFPNAEIGEDNDGQIIVYTDLRETEGGKVVRL